MPCLTEGTPGLENRAVDAQPQFDSGVTAPKLDARTEDSAATTEVDTTAAAITTDATTTNSTASDIVADESCEWCMIYYETCMLVRSFSTYNSLSLLN